MEFGTVVCATDATSAKGEYISRFDKNVQFLLALGGIPEAESVRGYCAEVILGPKLSVDQISHKLSKKLT